MIEKMFIFENRLMYPTLSCNFDNFYSLAQTILLFSVDFYLVLSMLETVFDG